MIDLINYSGRWGDRFEEGSEVLGAQVLDSSPLRSYRSILFAIYPIQEASVDSRNVAGIFGMIDTCGWRPGK